MDVVFGVLHAALPASTMLLVQNKRARTRDLERAAEMLAGSVVNKVDMLPSPDKDRYR